MWNLTLILNTTGSFSDYMFCKLIHEIQYMLCKTGIINE